MTLRNLATFFLFSNISLAILIGLMLCFVYVWYMYMRVTQLQRVAIDAVYIDPDDPTPDRTLELMQSEFRRQRGIVKVWTKRFYYALGAVVVYGLLISVSSHYLH